MKAFYFTVLIFTIVMFGFCRPTWAELDIDVSEPNLEITTGFSGDTLTLFGTASPKGDIIILVKGPEKQTVIRRKIDVMGLWVQAESVTFNTVPGYYNVASSSPVNTIASPQTLRDLRLGINSLTFPPKEKISAEKHNRFQEALIQNKQLKQLYSLTPDAVIFLNDSLFKTRISMPAYVPLGDYTIEAFLFKDGQLIDRQTKPFNVAQTGFTGDVHKFAFANPPLYGLTVIFIAIFSGILATFILRRD